MSRFRHIRKTGRQSDKQAFNPASVCGQFILITCPQVQNQFIDQCVLVQFLSIHVSFRQWQVRSAGGSCVKTVEIDEVVRELSPDVVLTQDLDLVCLVFIRQGQKLDNITVCNICAQSSGYQQTGMYHLLPLYRHVLVSRCFCEVKSSSLSTYVIML